MTVLELKVISRLSLRMKVDSFKRSNNLSRLEDGQSRHARESKNSP